MKMSAIKEKPIHWLKESIDTDPSTCVPADTPVTEAADALLKSPRKIIAIVKNGIVEAISTRTDITKSVVDLAQKKLEPTTTIYDIANVKNFYKIKKDDTIDDLLRVFLKEKFENLLIVDKDNKFYGIVNRRKLASELEELTS